MRRALWLMMVIVLCCAAGAAASEVSTDARLQEAQLALDEATRLEKEGKYTQAISRAEHALALREAVLGDGHLEVATCLNLLGNLHRQQSEHARGEPLLQRALAIREAALGNQHLLVAESLNDLATLYLTQNAYGRVEPLLQRALAIREAALGNQHFLVAESLHNLASLYRNQGLHELAEPLYQRTLAIKEAALGKHHPDVATSLHSLGLLYTLQGLHGQARPLYQRAVDIREAALGEHHPDVGKSLHNLAETYYLQGFHAQAEPLLQRALAIKEAALGKHHPSVATSLNTLANIYRDQGLYGQAEPHYQRALAIQEAAFGKNLHRMLATAHQGLAYLYYLQGLYGQAEPHYQRALAIQEAVLGKRHPEVAQTLIHLAQQHLAQRRLGPALPLLTRAMDISEQRLRKEALAFSESRLTGFLQHLRVEEELHYSLLRAHPDNPQVRRLALSSALLRKGRSVEESSNTSRTILRSLDPSGRDTFERLRSLRSQLAELSHQGSDKLSPAAYQQHLKDLAEQGDALEAELARRSAPLRALSTLPPPDEIVDRVAAALPKDGALVEFVAHADQPLVPKPGPPRSKRSSQLRYLALILFPDARIRVVDLGPAAPIDQAASTLRNALARRDAAFQRPAQALHARAFKPLLPLLGDTRRLFLAPDGQLSLVPFSALHDGRRFLIDAFDFSYVTSGKDLLPRSEHLPSSSSVVILADPDFSATPTPPSSQEELPALASRSDALERFFSTVRAGLPDQTWAPLPGTRQEAEAIQRLIPQARLFLGPEASKQRLLQLATPGVLHIATHGFFLEDEATPTGSRAVGHIGSGGATAQRPPDPLLRSGLVLSGAHAPAPPPSATPRPRADGALLTALELAGLDLWGTQLVVLSACDTGRGDVKLGQGVYGLRRALVTAGAETVVMSLWKVNDDTTRLLMEDYYRHLLAGQGRAAALRQAMLSLREKQPHPYSWAPFIALGSDAPLRSLAPPPQPPPDRGNESPKN